MGELTALPQTPYLHLRGPTSKGRGEEGKTREGRGIKAAGGRGEGGKGKGWEGEEGKENGDRPPIIFGLEVALR